ncbi:MAG: hypothetical protein MUF49_21210 [Oculatellaceae cyanobacterium Prado106]|jgi:hypothetical protein|nr:hypothetical protein [Oculatellaceae cyanobacterium Prado106]
MAKMQKRSSSSATVSKSAITDATAALQGLPEKPKENWSLREAVSMLQDSITDALSKGYSYVEVSKMLSQKGVEISASSLKSYLSAAKRTKPGAAAPRGRRGRKSIDVLAAATAELEAEAPAEAPKRTRRPRATAAAAEAPAPKRRGRAKAEPKADTASSPKTVRSRTTKAAAEPKASAKPAPRRRKKLL